MRLELTTYALRKRRRDDASAESSIEYKIDNSKVAALVAFETSDNAREVVRIPDDLVVVIEQWGKLSPGIREAIAKLAQPES